MGIIIAVVFIVILVVVALYISLQKKEIVEESAMPVIHTSGIYSVIRKSPRDNLFTGKPPLAEIRDWLAKSEKDGEGLPLTDADRKRIADAYERRLEATLKIVEESDRLGVQRFLIRAGDDGPFCKGFRDAPFFITREDIFRHPELLPPYYPGCTCALEPELERMLDPDIRHYIVENGPFALPPWKNIKKG